jgi:putative chitinase
MGDPYGRRSPFGRDAATQNGVNPLAPEHRPWLKPAPPPAIPRSPQRLMEDMQRGQTFRSPAPIDPLKEQPIPWVMGRPEAFFQMAAEMYGGRLSPAQATWLGSIIKHGSGHPIADLAYVLATADHETDQFTSLAERGMGEGKEYGRPGSHGGQRAYGRGPAMLTWDYNYDEFDRILGAGGRLRGNYDLAKDPDFGSRILIHGLTRDQGFTGKGTPFFLPNKGLADESQFREARRVVNGTDQAEKIARRALLFQDGLVASGYLDKDDH